MRYAADKLGKLRLLVFARHAEVRESALQVGLRDLPVELWVEGVVDSVQVVQRLCASDVLLFVRGTISSRRGSATAGIACGLPIIAFWSWSRRTSLINSKMPWCALFQILPCATTSPAAAVLLVGNIFRGPPLPGISQRYYVDRGAHTGPSHSCNK